MRKVLITGADGFLGRNLVRKLLSVGCFVEAIVYPGNNIYVAESNNNLEVFEIDLRCIEGLSEKLPNDIDVLYHLAWVGVKPEDRNNMDIQLNNIELSMNVMKMAVAKQIKKVVFPGSTNEYLYSGGLIGEKTLPSPSNAYGAVKVSVRYLCSEYAKRNSIDFEYAIITGIYAADRRDNNVIFYTIDKLLNKEKPSLSKLDQLWDYVYIDDVVEALRLIGAKGVPMTVYTIGHGDNWPLKKYIEIIHKMIDESIPLGIGEIEYESEILPSSCVDLYSINKDTGFEPKIPFEKGIANVIHSIMREKGV